VQELERALAGDGSPGAQTTSAPLAGTDSGNRPFPLVLGQVVLLWVAVLASLLLREAARGQVGA